MPKSWIQEQVHIDIFCENIYICTLTLLKVNMKRNNNPVNCSHVTVHRGGVFGHADGPEVISDLNCNGTESDISACTNITYTERPCSPGNEVGITCGESVKLSVWLGLYLWIGIEVSSTKPA